MARPEGTKYLTPDELWQFFQNYKQTIKLNPRKRMVFVGKDGNKEYEELERPLTLEGFSNFIRAAGSVKDIWHYFTECQKDTSTYGDYLDICRAIKSEIKQDQIEGGMVGQYNPSITQRLNGLVDKTENENKNTNYTITMDLGEKKPNE